MRIHTIENNNESQLILEFNRERLGKQCELVLELFRQGKRLTVRSAMIEHGIGDLRRRVADLKENGYNVQSEIKAGGFKEYWL